MQVRQPRTPRTQEAPLAGLPDPDRIAAVVHDSSYGEELRSLADEIRRHRVPLFGQTIDLGPEIAWRRDYRSDIETGIPFFRMSRSLDHSRVGDCKLIWELNRHQHLVVLAQAARCWKEPRYEAELVNQLESWWAANPVNRGINWAAALEVAFRALSWVWLYHLAGDRWSSEFRIRFLRELYAHGCYVERNLSVYHSPNTHLLGEVTVLHALGTLFPSFPRAERWASVGGRLVHEQMNRQVREDGSHYEQSSYYHLYALDLFLLHATLADVPASYSDKLRRMADYLASLCGASRELPLLGDDDGGRVFHPYGPRVQFPRATLATCARVTGIRELLREPADLYEQAVWWLGPEVLNDVPSPKTRAGDCRWFSDAGVAVMETDQLQVIMDAGPLGEGTGGHSHADALSLLARFGKQNVLTDPGTYCYGADLRWRDWFRGTAAHNTVRVDGQDQAVAAGLFRWSSKPVVRMLRRSTEAGSYYLDAICEYHGVRHRRRIMLADGDLLIVLDEVEGPPGEHSVEQFWHCGEPSEPVTPFCYRIGPARLAVAPTSSAILAEGGEYGWHSVQFSARQPSPVLIVTHHGILPARMAAAVCFRQTVSSLETETGDEAMVAVVVDGVRREFRMPA